MSVVLDAEILHIYNSLVESRNVLTLYPTQLANELIGRLKQIQGKCSVGMKMSFGFILMIKRKKKKETVRQFYEKRPFAHSKFRKATWQHKRANKNFNYVMIADRLRTLYYSWSNESHRTGMVKPVHGIQIFTLTAKSM